MNTKMKTMISGSMSVFALAALSSVVVSAAPSTANGTNNSVWSYRAVADVSTQVNIRAYASVDSEIIGYLSKGASADVVEKGEEWSHIISNGVEGYIKNEYLAYGSDAEYLASVYGMQGVKVNWDGVNIFAAPSAAAAVVDTATTGEEYSLIAAEGAWYQIQLNEAETAYVPEEDVEKTIITERAVSLMSQKFAADTYAAVYTTEDTYTTTGSSQTDTTASAGSAQTQTNTQNTQAAQTPAVPSAGTVSNTPETQPTTTASSSDLKLLAAIIYCEAGNQSREGKVAVGAVVMNRVASSSFPNNIHDVIYQSGQFTPAYSGTLASALANGVPSSCTEAAQAALNGENPVGNALYFNTGSGKGIKIGAHQFY